MKAQYICFSLIQYKYSNRRQLFVHACSNKGVFSEVSSDHRVTMEKNTGCNRRPSFSEITSHLCRFTLNRRHFFAHFQVWIQSLLWLVSTHTPERALSRFQLQVSFTSTFNIGTGCATCVTWWCQEVTELKGGTTDEHFRSSVFCGREELRSAQTSGLLTVKTFYMHRNLHSTLK